MIEAAEIFAVHLTEVLARYEQVFRKIISLIMAGRVYNWLKTTEFSVFGSSIQASERLRMSRIRNFVMSHAKVLAKGECHS